MHQTFPSKCFANKKRMGNPGPGQEARDNLLLLSIITVVHNNKEGLRKTYASLEPQLKYANEWIIIDGASTDGTVELLREFNHPSIRWISEQDSGIYDAMNKGAEHAGGDYLLFLNSGDEVLPNALDIVHHDLTSDAALMFRAYSTVVINQDNREITYFPEIDRLVLHMSICHSSTVIPRQFFFCLKGYNLAYKLASDYDLLLRAHLKRFPFTNSKSVLSRFYRGGVSDKRMIRSRWETIVSLWINNSPHRAKGSLIIIREFLYSCDSRYCNALNLLIGTYKRIASKRTETSQ